MGNNFETRGDLGVATPLLEGEYLQSPPAGAEFGGLIPDEVAIATAGAGRVAPVMEWIGRHRRSFAAGTLALSLAYGLEQSPAAAAAQESTVSMMAGPFVDTCTPATAPEMVAPPGTVVANDDCVRIYAGDAVGYAHLNANDQSSFDPSFRSDLRICEVDNVSPKANVILSAGNIDADVLVKKGESGSFDFAYKLCSSEDATESDPANVHVEIVPVNMLQVTKSKRNHHFKLYNPNNDYMAVAWRGDAFVMPPFSHRKGFSRLHKIVIAGALNNVQFADAGQTTLKFKRRHHQRHHHAG